MEELYKEPVIIRPAPNVVLNLTRRVLSQVELECRNLQSSFRPKKIAVLTIGDVASVVGAILIFVFAVDVIYALLTRKKDTNISQNSKVNNSDSRVNLGVVVTSFMAQITWPTKIFESVHYAHKYGIYGCLLIPTNAALAITFFVLLLLEFRTKAPGARTIAQFVHYRFGTFAHILAIVITLMAGMYNLTFNVGVGLMVLNSVSASVCRTAIVSVNFILVGVLLLLMRRGSFGIILSSFILAVLCISAFLIFIIVNVPTFQPLGSTDSFHKLLLCYDDTGTGYEIPPSVGFRTALLTENFINFIYNVVRVFLDQANWDTSINLPPNHGIIGLLLANLMAFCIPFGFGIVCGLGYRALESSFFNERLLNESQRESGLVIFALPIQLLEREGLLALFFVILLLLINSSVFSISGASSILYHDVLATYIRPFKRRVDPKTCLLCGKRRGHLASRRNICRCRSMLECAECQTDTWIKHACRTRPPSTIVYGCRMHGAYRTYADEMSSSVRQIAFTIMAGMIPVFIVFNRRTVVTSLYLGMCTPFIGCLCLCIVWARLTKMAFLVGYFVNAAISVTLLFSLEHISGLSSELSKLIGLAVGLLGGFLLPLLITLFTTRSLPPEVAPSVWSSVQEIDNPLIPWPEVFTRQTDLRFSPRMSEKKPALAEVRRALASLRHLACGLVVFYVIIFFGIYQILGFSIDNYSFAHFYFFLDATILMCQPKSRVICSSTPNGIDPDKLPRVCEEMNLTNRYGTYSAGAPQAPVDVQGHMCTCACFLSGCACVTFAYRRAGQVEVVSAVSSEFSISAPMNAVKQLALSDSDAFCFSDIRRKTYGIRNFDYQTTIIIFERSRASKVESAQSISTATSEIIAPESFYIERVDVSFIHPVSGGEEEESTETCGMNLLDQQLQFLRYGKKQQY
ncbi:hypothetical protein Aperf_G00000020487 [Anoplocephala perfoliata]